MADGKMYVLGKRGFGVLFVKTDPFRASIISDQAVQAYEASNPAIGDGYAEIAAAAKGMIAEADGNASTTPMSVDERRGIKKLVSSGTTLTDLDFAFFTDIVNAGWDVSRKSYDPLEDALEQVGPAGAAGTLNESDLMDDDDN